MADQPINTFDDKITRDLLKMRADWQRGDLTRANRRRRPPLPDDPTRPSHCTRVRFQILVADPASRSALVHILARQGGCSVADIPGTLFDGQVIEVCDPSGCFLNETQDALEGREGWAEWVLPISGASHCQSGDTHYYLTEEWEVFSLCCATQACQL